MYDWGITTLMDDLYNHPALYDAVCRPTAHVSWLPGPCAAGIGRRFGIGVRDWPVVFTDSRRGIADRWARPSEPMLRMAREQAAAANVSMEYVLGDMRDFEFGRQFGLIFIGRNSLLHLHSTEDLLATFAAVRRHLAPGGIFAFDIFNPNVRFSRGLRTSAFQPFRWKRRLSASLQSSK